MTRMIRTTFLIVAVFASLTGLAQADPIVYIFSGTGSGTLDGQSFNGAFTITAMGNTSTVAMFGAATFVSPNLVTVTAGGVTDTFTSSSFAVGNDGSGKIGLQDQVANHTVVDGTNAALASYNLVTALPITTLTPAAYTSYSISTIGGSFNLAANSVTALTFTAVPEPASLAMLGTSVVGLLGYGLRRRAKASSQV